MVCNTYENVVFGPDHQLCSNIGLSENERVVVKVVIATMEKETSMEKRESEIERREIKRERNKEREK